MKTFVRNLTVLAVFLELASWAVYRFVPSVGISPNHLFALLFLYLSTLFIFMALHKSMEKRTSQFANAVMLVNFGKLLLYGIVIFVYAQFNREDAVPFILTFFVYYFFFSFYEVLALLKRGSGKA